jgi:hypothetical protein
MWFQQENAGHRGYFEGTNYDALFYEQRLSERHSLNLTALYTPILELKILKYS